LLEGQTLVSLCKKVKPWIDKACYSLSESERMNKVAFFDQDVVDQVEGRGGTLATVSKRATGKLRIRTRSGGELARVTVPLERQNKEDILYYPAVSFALVHRYL
jgi:hypothetical protein